MSSFDSSRSKTALELGHFLLFEYSKRVEDENGYFGSEWQEFKVGLKALSTARPGNLETPSQLLEQVCEELSFYINGVSFGTELLSEISSLIKPEHFHLYEGPGQQASNETCWACLSSEDFRAQFNLLEVWRGGHFNGIRDPQVLDELASILGDFDGIAGYLLAGNPFCSKELLNELAPSRYTTTMSKFLSYSGIHDLQSNTQWRVNLSLELKKAGYFA